MRFQFIEIAIRHGCSPVNLLHIFKILFPKNTSGRLLLKAINTAPEMSLPQMPVSKKTIFSYSLSPNATKDGSLIASPISTIAKSR